MHVFRLVDNDKRIQRLILLLRRQNPLSAPKIKALSAQFSFEFRNLYNLTVYFGRWQMIRALCS